MCHFYGQNVLIFFLSYFPSETEVPRLDKFGVYQSKLVESFSILPVTDHCDHQMELLLIPGTPEQNICFSFYGVFVHTSLPP